MSKVNIESYYQPVTVEEAETWAAMIAFFQTEGEPFIMETKEKTDKSATFTITPTIGEPFEIKTPIGKTHQPQI